MVYRSEDGILRIGLTGKMRSGKDTVARHLYLEHDFRTPIAFGSALKYFAHKIFPDVPSEPKPRALYQHMNVMREYDPDVWVKHLAREVALWEGYRDTTGIVVTDARQQNEIDWLRDNGFVIVRIEAPEDERLKRIEGVGDATSPAALAHKTESEVDGFDVDYTIVNDGTFDELLTKVDEMVAELREDD